MSTAFFTLGDAARILSVPPYQITYLLSTGKVPEPVRVGNRRLFTHADLARIAEYLKVAGWEGHAR
jgi:DNA-binding transcriptional MerR regulator